MAQVFPAGSRASVLDVEATWRASFVAGLAQAFIVKTYFDKDQGLQTFFFKALLAKAGDKDQGIAKVWSDQTSPLKPT
jgi:hypothetical protein